MGFQKDDYLWIEFGEQIKEKNGSVTQPLCIYYGRFPHRKGDGSELEDLRGYYTLNKKDERGNIYYGINIERDKDVSFVRINSLNTNRFTVLVKGEKDFGKIKYNYLAKTSFFLFGHARIRKKETKPLLSSNKKIVKRIEICANPEYSVWRQTGIPIKLTVLFDENPLEEKKIRIVDESGDYIDIETDEVGDSIYIPPDDQRLKRKGTTAYKQTIIFAEEADKGTTYKSSYTLLLHPSRFGNRNFILGSSIFGGTVAIVFITTFIQRKKFQI